jgi:hypothetical protein
MAKQVLSKIVVAALALGPVAAIVGFFRGEFSRHPVLTVAGLVVWEIVVLAGGVFGKAFEKLQDRWASQLAEWLDALLRRTISRYTRHYRYFLSRVHHDVDLRGLSTWGMHSLAMEEVFVDLSLMPELPHRVPTGAVSDAATAGVPDEVRQSIWQLLERYPDEPLAVLGPPGSGKTTLLRHVTLTLCGYQRQFKVARQWRRKLPVLLALRQHAATVTGKPDVTLVEVVRATLKQLPKAEPSGWLERQLDKGRCVVMLDGLDEVARREDRALVMEWVRGQMQRYPRNQFILTSRPGGFNDPPLITATTVRVRQFDDAQIRRFVHGWYRAVEGRSANRKDIGVAIQAEESANKLLDRVYASPELLALAVNPLLLTMMTSVHKYRAALPGSRAALYREICEAFLGKRQEAKNLPLAQSIEQQLLILQRLAFGMMVDRVRDIPAREASAMIQETLHRIGYKESADAFLRQIEHSSGLLVERDAGFYSFAHLTFQEYLAASHIAEKFDMDFLVRQLGDSWWREVVLFRVATADATPILRAILKEKEPSVELLSLADESLEQARDIDARVRKEASERLSWRYDVDPARQRLVANVLLRRKLRNVIRASSGAFICPEPVTNAEYDMFLTLAAHHYNFQGSASKRQVFSGNPVEPVVGVSPRSVVDFMELITSIGVSARLPKSDDLRPSDLKRLVSSPHMQFWQDARINGDGQYAQGKLPGDFISFPNGLTAPRDVSFDSRLEKLFQDQLSADVSFVFGWHDYRMPPYFSDEPRGLLVAEWERFWDAMPWINTDHRILDGPFPESLLSEIQVRSLDRPQVPPALVDGLLRRYRTQSLGLVNTLRREWASGGYWQAPQCENPDDAGIVGLRGGTKEAVYLRAYLRLIAREQLLSIWPISQRSRNRSISEIARAQDNARRPRLLWSTVRSVDPEEIRRRAMLRLAWQYLYEWRENGTLSPVEGILLARA